jgi:hypothetical protein
MDDTSHKSQKNVQWSLLSLGIYYILWGLKGIIPLYYISY